MDLYRAQVLVDQPYQLGEGPVWDAENNTLYYTDIMGSCLHSINLSNGLRSGIQLSQHLGCFALRRQGGFVLGMAAGIYLREADGKQIRKLDKPQWSAMVRANDGKCDPKGRFWCGTSDLVDGARQGGLYLLDEEGGCEQLLSGLECANGLAFDGDTVYFIDSPRRRVDRYTFDEETLTLRDEQPAVEIDAKNGLPDGMTMDEEGMLWVAHWGGGFVGRYDPRTGRLLAKVETPASQTTSCCFGGSDGKTLFITSAAVGKSGEPRGGNVFVARVPVAGAQSWVFGADGRSMCR